MLRSLDEWCASEDKLQWCPELPPSILAMLLDDELNTRVKFVDAAKSRIRRKPLNIDVPFNPPVFPFDNSLFLDPFYLVEDFSDEPIDLGAVRAMDDKELDKYLGEVYERFILTGKDSRAIKKKELIQYAGKNYYFNAFGKNATKGTRKADPARGRKRFITHRSGSMSSIHVPETMKLSILRRKAGLDDCLVTKQDVVNYKRRSDERVNILVAIDRSKSMEQCGKLEQAKKAALSFNYYRSVHHSNSRVEFIAFNDKITKTDPLDILSLRPSGMTHTAEFFAYIHSYITKGALANSEVYIITDGYPQKMGIKDSTYLAFTFGTAKKLKCLDIKLKVIVISLPGEQINTSYLAYNKLICDTLGGELVRIDVSDLTKTLIGD